MSSDMPIGSWITQEWEIIKGLSPRLQPKFYQMNTLLSQNTRVGGVGVWEDNQSYKYYLMIKQGTQDKVTYYTLFSALCELCKHDLKRSGKVGTTEANYRFRELILAKEEIHD